jgi:hypothetical protein
VIRVGCFVNEQLLDLPADLDREGGLALARVGNVLNQPPKTQKWQALPQLEIHKGQYRNWLKYSVGRAHDDEYWASRDSTEEAMIDTICKVITQHLPVDDVGADRDTWAGLPQEMECVMDFLVGLPSRDKPADDSDE